MRILFCNKYNYPFSGTEAYIFEVMELLRSNGHEVALFSMADPRGKPSPYDQYLPEPVDFKQPARWWHRATLAAHAIYSPEARRKIRAMIADFRPDIAHVRNVYHHLSPSILWELKAQNVPIIYHLNDFKALCPSYNLVSRGEACEACKGGAFWHALKEQCYPGRAAQLMLVLEAYVHSLLGSYRKCVDCFLAPSRFVRDKFIEHGWDGTKFEILPHFQPIKDVIQRDPNHATILYFGRLSPEKGLHDLLHAMRRLPHLDLAIAGDGPQRIEIEQLSVSLGLQNVFFLGQLRGPELDHAIAQSRFTVLPSHAYETLGKTILESYAWGRAVVASDLGSRRELVHPGVTGLLYKPGDITALTAALELLGRHSDLADRMGNSGRELVRHHHTPQAHYEILLALYARLAAGQNRSRDSSTLAQTPRKWPLHPISAQKSNFIPIQRLKPFAALGESPISLTTSFPRRRLRIAFIGGRGVVSKYSGIETYYEEVGKRLAAMGHEVTVYCRSYFTPAARHYQGIKIVRLPTVRTKHAETLLHTFLSTIHVLCQPCDVVHYHALGPALFSFIPRLFGKKTVVTVQGLDWQRKKWGRIAAAVLRIGERAAVTLPSSTMVVSQTLSDHYRAHHQAETFYIPNGGLLRERRPPGNLIDLGLEPQGYILFLGRFSPEKGCHVLLEAYEKLHTNVKLVMAGASSYCADYARQLRAHASQKIVFLDSVSGEALDELLTNCMIFVLPSALEGLSLALLDAMGAGLCVLASAIPENREAVQAAGFTFRAGDAMDLADRLKFLISNPAVREAAGRSAKLRIRDHYQWSDIAERVERVYFHVMGWKSIEISPEMKTEAPLKKMAASATTALAIFSRKAG
ncbi:MAG TPA: glycosyltransferase family 4 protein [Candidatus Sulfotelmatobacter sp.]|jgi:glycosyltransferase involved in cell wall biosynthesis